MSRWGNCHDNAVANSYFQLLKRERISRKNYLTQQAARSDIFNYIAVFYNASRCHSSADGLMPAEFGKNHFIRPQGVEETLGDSGHCDIPWLGLEVGK